LSTGASIASAGHESTELGHELRRLWSFRELLKQLVLRELKLKHKSSVLGVAWTLLNPVLMLLILLAVFTQVVRVPIPSYWAFLLSGYFVWHFMSHALGTGSSILSGYSVFIRSAAIPNEIPVVAAVLSRLIEFCVELLLIAVLLAAFHHGSLPASFSLLPILLVPQLLIAIGLALPLAAVSVFYYDVRQMVPIAVTALFYLTPVFYSLDLVPEPLRYVLYLNPLTGLLDLYRLVLYEGAFPSFWNLGAMAAVSFGIGSVGYAIFNRNKHVFPEIV
jgi:ABC-2 type transport system permease protein